MINFSKTLKATGITSSTMVGYVKREFPMLAGNCFSVSTNEGEHRIVNFNCENLEELLRTEVVSFPITIIPLGDYNVAMIADERIPNEWYSTLFCSTCTPREYISPVDRLRQILDIKRDKRVEQEYTMPDGTKGMIIRTT